MQHAGTSQNIKVRNKVLLSNAIIMLPLQMTKIPLLSLCALWDGVIPFEAPIRLHVSLLRGMTSYPLRVQSGYMYLCSVDDVITIGLQSGYMSLCSVDDVITIGLQSGYMSLCSVDDVITIAAPEVPVWVQTQCASLTRPESWVILDLDNSGQTLIDLV